MSRHLGSFDAATLSAVIERGDWLDVSIGRRVLVVREDGRRPIYAKTNLGKTFATCNGCGEFARVDLILTGTATLPFCGKQCLEAHDG